MGPGRDRDRWLVLLCKNVYIYSTMYYSFHGRLEETLGPAWAGSLAHNNYRNNVSRMTKNVLKRFVNPKPF